MGGSLITEAGLAKRDVPSAAVYQRRDNWWIQPAAIFLALSAFVVYATWAGLQTQDFMYTEDGAHYLSPFYSPCLAEKCGELAFAGTPLFAAWTWSPAILILGVPVGFRLTCYYYRKAYYRSFWADPPGCAVTERKKGYRGENAFPLILQNVHRYVLWLALGLLVFLWYDALIAFRFLDEATGGYRFGVSFIGLFLALNSFLLTIYTFSCHSLRHVVGGGSDCFSCTLTGRAKKTMWRGVTLLNKNHMMWAWFSLVSVGLSDLLVRMTVWGWIPDVRFF